jgi:putative flippase GtrA
MEAVTSEAGRFLRFAVVGGIGFVIDAGLLALLHYAGGVDPFLARLVSISASAFSTWRMNRALTFGASARKQAVEGLRYGTVAGLTAGVNYLVYALALIIWPALPPVIAAVLATLIAMGFSYAGYSRFVFGTGSGADATVGPRSQRR